jgi:hypothetical protein
VPLAFKETNEWSIISSTIQPKANFAGSACRFLSARRGMKKNDFSV